MTVSAERSSELRQCTVPLYALCFRSYNRAAARDFLYSQHETNAHPNGHPVAWRVCHRSRAGQLAYQRGEHGDSSNRAVRPRSDLRNGSGRQFLQRGEHGDSRSGAVRPRSDLRNGRRFQFLCVRAAALSVRSVRRIAERHADAVFGLRVRSAQRHLSEFGGSSSYDNGTSSQHQRQRANRHYQRHVGRW
jgi:hypothetical protein